MKHNFSTLVGVFFLLLFSCQNEIEDNEIVLNNEFVFNDIQYIPQRVDINYIGSKLTVIEFIVESGIFNKLILSITNGTEDRIQEGDYYYNSMNMGFKMNLYYDSLDIRAKSGHLTIDYDNNAESYEFKIDITTQDGDILKGHLKEKIQINNHKNSFIFQDSIYDIKEAFSLYHSNPDYYDFNYIYFLNSVTNLDSLYTGFIFFGSNSTYIEEGNYAWGGQFGAMLSINEDTYYDASNGVLWVNRVNGKNEIYDVYYSITCGDYLVRGQYYGEIPIYQVE